VSLWYSIREGLAGFRRARLASAITVFTVAFALVLMGLSAIVAVNLGQLVVELRSRVQIEVFLDPGLSDEQAQKLEEKIRAVRGVSGVEFVSKERAALEFKETFGEDVLAILEENPLPASFRIRLARQFQNSAAAQEIAALIERLPGVDEVLYRGDVLRFLDRYAGMAAAVGLVIGAVLGLGSILLVANTIRLVIMARSNVIEIMRLVGATAGFIRRPFVIHGMIEGILGGLLGSAFLWLLVELARIQIPNLIVVDRRWYIVVVAVGWLLGWLGSSFAIRKYLK